MKQTSLPLRLNVGIAWKNGELSVSTLIDVPQGPDFSLRSTTQMSIWPTLPGLPDEKNSCLVDMNLSPSWIDRLARHGFEAVHWSTIGAATAPDVEILTWANEHHFIVITNDLDFSAILAASSGATPSVVQIRTQDLLSDEVVTMVAEAHAHREDVERGALLSIDEAGTRVRMLSLRGSQETSQLLGQVLHFPPLVARQ